MHYDCNKAVVRARNVNRTVWFCQSFFLPHPSIFSGSVDIIFTI